MRALAQAQLQFCLFDDLSDGLKTGLLNQKLTDYGKNSQPKQYPKGSS